MRLLLLLLIASAVSADTPWASTVVNMSAAIPAPYSWEEFMERVRYRQPADCVGIPKNIIGSDIPALISQDFTSKTSVYERIKCTTKTCMPVEYAEYSPRCVQVSLPDWRLRDGEFIYGVLTTSGKCICRIAHYQDLLDLVGRVKALEERCV
jgi:hypothetical protein